MSVTTDTTYMSNRPENVRCNGQQLPQFGVICEQLSLFWLLTYKKTQCQTEEGLGDIDISNS